MVTEAKKRFARHVKITLSCENCHNQSTHVLVVEEVESHAASYFEHHSKCSKPAVDASAAGTDAFWLP